MLNTGILLKKPGESVYARYRRFAIANHGLHVSYQAIRMALIAQSSCRGYSGRITSVQLAQEYEKNRICEDSLRVETPIFAASVTTVIKKNCVRCAEVGYHSDVFDILWVSTCPIHNEPLTYKCTNCNNTWPTAYTLYSHDCNVCGVRLSTDKLVARGAFRDQEGYESLSKLHEVFRVDRAKYPDTYSLLNDRLEKINRRQLNQLSGLYPSLEINSAGDEVVGYRVLLERCGIPVYDIQTMYFRAKSALGESHASLALESSRTKYLGYFRKIVKRVLKAACKRNHRLGQCSRERLHASISCSCCNSWEFWNTLDDTVDNRSFHGDDRPMYTWLERSRLIEFHDEHYRLPDFPAYLQTEDEGECVRVGLPRRAQKLIFYVDLWTTLRSIYNAFRQREMCFKNEELPPTFSNYQLHLMLPRRCIHSPRSKFYPMYIECVRGEYKLSVPKMALGEQLEAEPFEPLRYDSH